MRFFGNFVWLELSLKYQDKEAQRITNRASAAAQVQALRALNVWFNAIASNCPRAAHTRPPLNLHLAKLGGEHLARTA